MNKCSICSMDFENLDLEIKQCSPACQSANEMLIDLTEVIGKTQPSNDPRIFFYPLSFGRLIDEYTILCLRRSSTRSIKRQQEIDYCIFKCKKSIQTSLGQIFYDKIYRTKMTAAIVSLFLLNALMWRNNDLARNQRLPEGIRMKSYFENVELGQERGSLIQQLDVMLSGKSTFYKVYCGREV